MSSKFFTWTKGDRKNAPEVLYTGGIVPIPVECIHIKGLEYPRTPKNDQRRPTPLTLNQTHELPSPFNQRLDDSSALQDAAVKSATSLIAVVNDMLRSPQPSANLKPALAENHGRPRSHTAPSTPMPEAPPHPPVELPGSIPDRPRAAHHHSFDEKLKPVIGPMHQDQRVSRGPRRSTHPWLQLIGTSKDKDKFTEHVETIRGPTTPKPRQLQKPRKDASIMGLDQSKGRASQEEVRPLTMHAQQFEAATASLDQALHENKSLFFSPGGQQTCVPRSPLHMDHPSRESALLARMSSLRASHETQLHALREAHRQEVETDHQYISLLEQHFGIRHADDSMTRPVTRQNLEHTTHNGSAEWSVFAATNTSKTSFAGLSLNQDWKPQRMVPLEALDSKCSAYRQSNVPYEGTGTEHDHLRETAWESQQEIPQSKQTIKRLQASEASLNKIVADLRSRLNASNISRLDAQEGLHEACERIRELTEREAGLVRYIELLQSHNRRASDTRLETGKTAGLKPRTRHCRTRSDISFDHNKSAVVHAQGGDVQKLFSRSDKTTAQLEIHRQERHSHHATMQARASASYNDGQLSTPERRSLREIVTPTLAGLTRSDNSPQPYPAERQKHQSRPDQTSKDHKHQSEKQDRAEHSNISPRALRHDPTMFNNPSSPASSPTAPPSLSPTQTPSPSALGISLPQTPRTISSATAEALLLTTEGPSSFTEPRTPPLGLHKKLPKPPAVDTSPPPAYSPALQRGETMKSVGESIIELYASKEGECWGRCEDGWVEWV